MIRAFVSENRGSIALAAGIVLLGIMLGLFVVSLQPSGRDTVAAVPTQTAASSARPSPPPSERPTATPAATPQPTATPTPVPASRSLAPSAAPSDDPAAADDVAAAIRRSIEALEELGSYRFETQIAGRSTADISSDQLFDMATRGALHRGEAEDVDLLFGFQMVEPGGVASAGSSSRVVVVGDSAWEIRRDREPLHHTREEVGMIWSALPAGLGRSFLLPIANGFAVAGEERKNGADAIRYEMTPAGRQDFARAISVPGTCDGEVWTAGDGGHLVAANIQCTPDDPDGMERGLLLRIDVSDANDPDITVEPPE